MRCDQSTIITSNKRRRVNLAKRL